MFEITRDPDRRGYILHAECVLPRPVDEMFAFFSQPENLAKLTPPWMHFKILTPEPIEMAAGTVLDYRVKILKFVPMRWRSKITTWEPGVAFADTQVRGPYTRWDHDHRFEAVESGTRMIDHVRYGVPGGGLVHRLLVKPDLEKIFAYRLERQREWFGLIEA
ncbi:MAG: SRPBCC family protein [Planctomycetota bacterium]